MATATSITNQFLRVQIWANKEVSALPLRIFRFLFGFLLVFSTIRFIYLGWIQDHYILPKLHFYYFGFEWLPNFSPMLIWMFHLGIILGGLGIALAGKALYRVSAILAFISFTATELIDITYYLNHYYYVTCICFLLCIVPQQASIMSKAAEVPRWSILIFQIQIAIVYFYAGIAKINEDWLFKALPLKIWLPAHYDIPVLGGLFSWKWSPYLFSWCGMLYDVLIPFLLWNKKSRFFAYATVIVFHTLTGILFQIGVFPVVMICGTLIFLEFKTLRNTIVEKKNSLLRSNNFLFILISAYFIFQILFPWRYLFYKGNVFWTEEGYRFSWRVMLMEKAGTAQFYIHDTVTNNKWPVDNSQFLNAHQEKQMATQPDLLLQFAKHLKKHFLAVVPNSKVTAEVYVTLNGRPGKLFIDSTIDLTKIADNWRPKKWILNE